MTLPVPAVLDLRDVDATMGDLVGGKAANLGELLSVGARVPPGFCVTTRAYDQVFGTLGADLQPGELRTKFAGAELPDALRAAITDSYTALGADVPVAVRSSATAEDLPHASFAGQQDTYLNVVGTEALLDAVRRCWSSLWTDRAVVYRENNGIDHSTVRLAVVVQRMVDAESSGVLFTANPVTGRRGEVVIDANAGLGESVVSGAVNPDHFVVDTASGEITTRQLGDKTVTVRSKPGGGTDTATHEADQRPSLDDDQIRELAAVGAEVARHYGRPQDIEWATSDGQVWLTQSRPVTTLFPLPAEPRPGLRAYFSINVAQGVYRPFTPMGTSVLRLGITAVIRSFRFPIPGPTALREADGWLFGDITAATRNPLSRRLAPRLMGMMEARSGKVFEEIKDDPRLGTGLSSPLPLIRLVAGAVLRHRMPITTIRALRDPIRTRQRVFDLVEELREGLRRADSGSPKEKLAQTERAIVTAIPTRFVRTLPPVLFPTLILSRFLPKILGDAVSAEEVQILLRGIPHNVTTEMDLELWRIAKRAGADPSSAEVFRDLPAEELVARYRERALPGPVQDELDAFLARDGHRAIAEIDAGMPRWSEDPTYLLTTIANYVDTAGTGYAADEQYERGVREAEEMAERVVARLRSRNRIRARLAGFAIDRVRQLVGLREIPKYCLVLVFANARRNLLSLGEDLRAAGGLDSADDIFFLRFEEVSKAIDGADLRALIAERRETYDRERRRRHLPRVLLSDGTEPEAEAEHEAGALRGTSASAGTVSGVAKVVLDPVGARLAPGEILVAPSTDPGWTPLFLTAGGLVMEMGGPNSHGATVAREYGIPAVVGVPDATTRIGTGQRITVHGSAGVVELPTESR